MVLLVFYLLFWHFPQTSDLILILNQGSEYSHWLQVGLFFSSIMVLAFLIGNIRDFYQRFDWKNLKNSIKSQDSEEEKIESAKALKVEDNAISVSSKKESIPKYVHRMFPKILGTLLLLIIAFSVAHGYEQIKDENLIKWMTAETGLLISIILLLLSLNIDLINFFKNFFTKLQAKDTIAPIVAIILFLGIIFYGTQNKGGSEEDIKRLFQSLFLLSLLYFVISTSYSKYILDFKYHVGSKVISILTVMSFITYLLLGLNPTLGYSTSLNPLPIIVICVVGLFTALHFIKILGKNWSIPLLPIVLIISLLLGIRTAKDNDFDHYNVSNTPIEINSSERITLKHHFKQWLKERDSVIRKHHKDEQFKAIFVSSEGGGSRAGLWSFLVNSYLYNRNSDYFNKHLVSMSGASGGTVGNSMFFNIARHNLLNPNAKIDLLANPEDDFIYKASSVYQNDFLSTSVAALMGRDLVHSIVGINSIEFDDRGALLENEWENSYKEVFKNAPSLANDFLSNTSLDKDGALPLLLINTVNVQTGQYSVISPVKFNDDIMNLGVFNDFLEDYNCSEPDSNIKFSTAMSLAARFPFISPVGKVENVGQFMDAGYYDNLGGTVTRRLHAAFMESISDYESTFIEKINPVFLIIANEDPKEEQCGTYDMKDLEFPYSAQLFAPLSGVLNATFAQVEEMKKTFGGKFLIESKRQILIEEGDTLKPILPLGRYLSTTVIKSLEKNLDNEVEVNKKLIEDLNNLIPEKTGEKY